MATAPDDAGTATPGEAPSPASPAETSGRQEYEFNEAEGRIIQDLGSRMSFAGLFMVGMGFCFAVSAIQRWSRYLEIEVGLLFLTMLFIVFGIWTHRAGAEFRRVADSKGRDVTHLMAALASLLSCYRLIYLLFFVGLIFAIFQLAATNVGG
ncbi:hypothetical protein [Paludisphaera sp.]|uniref:hypothetical protein n=1 Tax=Paludisphaera sp. TaxID=2017432 RepID=UPI00301C4E07